ncbi:HK-domain-containing protein [Gloeophyllum trabeum ATCC 11539]|uniref:HK-domain-containing protein n=1 Tax=Gloeophyllum trabeum (strain ATCC 11539 / FP-39264 / Madison 617) TaxID=670483 RepID=S7QBV2_GLOTA|nr:HK-domain-containing protein [Gloeophyllum trabeum ATCC 11539]EPQ57436.1 HK-domain-containing protein [Gloeophyllum trabeum ATCC 11539]
MCKAITPGIDYSLYLVTGRELLPEGITYIESLKQAIEGGVTVVQVREKKADTGEFLQIARESKELCDQHNIPLIVNDRIDIALAIRATGVHLGQTDMPVAVARSLLPPDTIIGVSCNTPEQVEKAVQDGADYVGLGAVYGTQTKDVSGKIIGPRKVGLRLEKLDGTNVKSVVIGGIKTSNVLRTLHVSVSTSGRTVDGVAVVSDIVASKTPRESARTLASLVKAFKLASSAPALARPFSRQLSDSLLHDAAALLDVVRKHSPLIHQITNTVVTNQSANATLALGASPIMATSPYEMEDLQKATGALLINFGTITDKEGMLQAGKFANLNKKPVVFDPVGVGATAYRRSTASELLNTWQASIIKGNAAEIGALADSVEVQAKGVDSGGSFKDPAAVIRQLARKERCVVVLSGVVDYITNGEDVVALHNGHPLLGQITGSGCMLGTAVATFAAAERLRTLESEGKGADEEGKLVSGDMLVAAVGGVLALTVASELAAAREDVKGSGTFLPALIDELGKLTPEVIASRAKAEVFSP